MAEAQRRTTHRVPFTDALHFTKPEAMEGRGVDIGAGGIGVQLGQDLAVGTAVEIEMFQGGATAYGHVRWSKPSDDGFRIGIQFREEDWAIMELVDALHSQEG